MKNYEITICVTGYQTMTIQAYNEDDAEELGLDMMDVCKLQVTEQYVHTIAEKPND